MLLFRSLLLLAVVLERGLARDAAAVGHRRRQSIWAIDSSDRRFSVADGNETTFGSRLHKRDLYGDYAVKGFLLGCLLENTQDGANAIARNTPSLSKLNGNVASPYGQYPESLTFPGWYVTAPTGNGIGDALQATQDARTTFGGAALNTNQFDNVLDAWYSQQTFTDKNGDQKAGRRSCSTSTVNEGN
jgi:hypothetical protein